MKNEYIKFQRKNYYSRIYVLFELVKVLKDREVIFMSKSNPSHCIRGLTIKSVDYLKDIFKSFGFFEKDYNIYMSTAKYSFLPNFTLNLKERSKETHEFFRKEILEKTIGYDCLLDFDRKDDDYIGMFTEVSFVKKILDTERITHYIIPSGSGFQIVIPHEVFSWERKFTLSNEPTAFNIKMKTFVKNIKTNLKLKTIDLINNGILNRIMKAPYSLVEDKVVLPIYDFKNFKYTELESKFVLDNVYYKNRGVHLFNNFDPESNRKNMDKFIYKYYLD